MAVLQAAVSACDSGDLIFVKTPFVANGTLTVDKQVTIATGLNAAYEGNGTFTDASFNSGKVPYIQTITVLPTDEMAGLKLQGLNIRNLNFHPYSDKYILDTYIDSCYFYMNTTNHGIAFEGDGGTGFCDSTVFNRCRFTTDDTNGTSYGVFNFKNDAAFITHTILRDCTCDLLSNNTTLFYNDGTGDVEDLELDNLRFYTQTGATGQTMFYCGVPDTDNEQKLWVNWKGGFIESHATFPIITIPDDAATKRRTLKFKIHDVDYFSGPMTLLADANHDWYSGDLIVQLYNCDSLGSLTYGTQVKYEYIDFVMKNNYGLNRVGVIANPILVDGSNRILSDFVGNSASWTSAADYKNHGSPKTLYILGGTTTAIKRNTATIATVTSATVPIIVHLEPLDVFSITFSVAPTITVIGE
jgi:hypothetical protein